MQVGQGDECEIAGTGHSNLKSTHLIGFQGLLRGLDLDGKRPYSVHVLLLVGGGEGFDVEFYRVGGTLNLGATERLAGERIGENATDREGIRCSLDADLARFIGED